MDTLMMYLIPGLVFAALIEYQLTERLDWPEPIPWWYRMLWIALWPFCVIMIVWGFIKGYNKDK